MYTYIYLCVYIYWYEDQEKNFHSHEHPVGQQERVLNGHGKINRHSLRNEKVGRMVMLRKANTF